MSDWFKKIAAGASLSRSQARALATEGFVVIPGPFGDASLAELVTAYDFEVLNAEPADVGEGASTTRVNDFVNRGPEFDPLYVHPPVLEACCSVIEQPFKLSSLLARTLHPQTPAQHLHVDFPRDHLGWPMLGFIFMVDEFRPDNGATVFWPGSQGAISPPSGTDGLVQACGPAGSMIIYNGSTWHGHAANVTCQPRRSIQGACIRRTETPTIDLAARMRAETLARLSPLAKYLLAL